MNSNSGRNVGRQSPTSKSVSVPTPRELQPTPVLMQLSSTMVLIDHTSGRAEVPPKSRKYQPDRK